MSEIMLQQEPIVSDLSNLEVDIKQEHLASIEFRKSLLTLAPELDIDPSRVESIGIAGEELIEDFGIDERLFDSEVATIFFTGLANEYSNLKEAEDSNFGAKAAHKEFIANTLVLLAGDKSDFSELVEELKGPISEKGQLEIYDRYTNVQVSEELKQELDSGSLLDSVREKMGISADTEQPYEVRVLNVASQDASDTYGMRPSYPKEIVEGKYSVGDDEYKDLLSEYDYDSDGFKKYEADLVSNGSSMSSELGMNGSFAPAWVTHLDGKTIMCIPLAYAEKILYKDEKRADYYTDDQKDRDVAFLKHEYVHTQSMLLADKEPNLGIALEELRAEHFSGDKHGYVDIKRHYRYLEEVTGFNPKSIFEKFGKDKPYNPKDFYVELAKHVGLDGLLDSITAFPRNYIESEDANKLLVEVDKYVGGLSGLQEKEWFKTIAKKGEGKVTEELKSFVTKISERMDPENFLPYGIGDTFLVNKMLEVWRKVKPEGYESPSGF